MNKEENNEEECYGGDRIGYEGVCIWCCVGSLCNVEGKGIRCF